MGSPRRQLRKSQRLARLFNRAYRRHGQSKQRACQVPLIQEQVHPYPRRPTLLTLPLAPQRPGLAAPPQCLIRETTRPQRLHEQAKERPHQPPNPGLLRRRGRGVGNQQQQVVVQLCRLVGSPSRARGEKLGFRLLVVTYLPKQRAAAMRMLLLPLLVICSRCRRLQGRRGRNRLGI